MKLIPVGRGLHTLVDDDDYDSLCVVRWYTKPSRGKRYVKRNIRVGSRSVSILMARLLVGAQNREYVDHINGNTLDNRRANLRVCTNSQNMRNMHARRSVCGYKGVHYVTRSKCTLSRPWQAHICLNGKTKYLGYFQTAEEAAMAYDAAARNHFGEFANPNFP